MEEDKINNPHNNIFVKYFSDPEIVKQFIAEYLEEGVVKHLDFDSLVLDSTCYMTPALKPYFSDIVWQVNSSKGEAKICFLFEHKRKQPPNIYRQLLRYILEIWDQAPVGPIPVVIPIIVYNGKKKWKRKPIEAHFRQFDQAFWRYIPRFEYQLKDLSHLPKEEIERFKDFVMMIPLVAMAHASSPEILVFLDLLKELFVNIKNRLDENYLQPMIVYILDQTPLNAVEIHQTVQNLSEPIKSNIMTTYQQIKNEGKLEGVLEGELKGKLETASEAIKAGLSDEVIQKITKLPLVTIKTLRKEIELGKY